VSFIHGAWGQTLGHQWGCRNITSAVVVKFRLIKRGASQNLGAVLELGEAGSSWVWRGHESDRGRVELYDWGF
jgi:hypothetical protein